MDILNINKIGRYVMLFLLPVLFLMTNCTEDEAEPLFDDLPTVRKEKQITELRDLLKSSTNGWKLTYFTDDTQLGGYSFIFNFKDDKKVDMISDFTGNFTIAESEYVVDYGVTVKLSFVTRNFIHDLSESDNAPTANLVGQGYKGDFEFLYYGVEGDEIIFRTNKTNEEVRFIKAEADDWTGISMNKDNIENIKGDPTLSVFRTLIVEGVSFDFFYNETTRFATSKYGNFGVGFTETGIVISPAINIDGKEITNLEFDDANKRFVGKDNDIELVSIEYANAPITPLTGYEDLNDFLDLNYFFNFDPILDNGGFNSYFQTILEGYQTNFSLEVTRIVVRDLDKTNGDLVILTNLGNFFYTFDKSIVDNKLILTKTQAAGPNDALFAPILDLFFDTQGIYVKREGTLSGFSNVTFSFTPASNTTLKFSFFTR